MRRKQNPGLISTARFAAAVAVAGLTWLSPHAVGVAIADTTSNSSDGGTAADRAHRVAHRFGRAVTPSAQVPHAATSVRVLTPASAAVTSTWSATDSGMHVARPTKPQGASAAASAPGPAGSQPARSLMPVPQQPGPGTPAAIMSAFPQSATAVAQVAPNVAQTITSSSVASAAPDAVAEPSSKQSGMRPTRTPRRGNTGPRCTTARASLPPGRTRTTPTTATSSRSMAFPNCKSRPTIPLRTARTSSSTTRGAG